MELLPIIYNSLLIAAGLFVVTVVISFISYKVKRNKGIIDDSDNHEPFQTVFRNKNKVEEELKPHYRATHPKPKSTPRVEEKKIVKEEVHQPKVKKEVRKEHSAEKEQKSEPPIEKNKRLERVTELVPSTKPSTDKREPKPVEQRKSKTEEQKSKKNLKSINDDPLKKYTDSAEDDLHPLKTDE